MDDGDLWPIVACRPTQLDMKNELDRTTAESTFVYEGSVQGTCKTCGRGVWIGPKAQEFWKMGAPVYCFACAVIQQHARGGDPDHDIHNLGNDEPVPSWVKPPPDLRRRRRG